MSDPLSERGAPFALPLPHRTGGRERNGIAQRLIRGSLDPGWRHLVAHFGFWRLVVEVVKDKRWHGAAEVNTLSRVLGSDGTTAAPRGGLDTAGC